MTRAQVIYVRPEATAYEGLCEECLRDLQEPASLGHHVALVRGSLRLEADVGFACCRRGHRIRLRRVCRDAAAPAVLPLRYGYR